MKYLKNDQIASKRPTAKIGSTLGLGGTKVDAIDHHAKKVKELRDKIEAKRADIDAELVDLRDYPLPFFNEKASNAWGPTVNEG